MTKDGIAGRVVGYAVGIVSVAWIAILFAYLFGFRSGIAPFDQILILSPDNFGDFLSGAFAPLAFILLAYSVWIQQQELRLTRDVMKDQEVALKSSSESNSALANETKIQNEIELNKNYLEYMKSMVENFYEICKLELQVQVPSKRLQNYTIVLGYIGNNANDRFAHSGFQIARNINGVRLNAISQNDIYEQNNLEYSFLGFCRIIEEIEAVSDLSDVSRALYRAHGFDQIVTALKDLKKALKIE
ncbi:hypothetical protein [Rhabdaerophilum sp.]|uniref:hypothetical protein n=1 Tax=Rhabdaerophilum sp. TaxID=2717341 RepID=UPI0038D41524